MKGKKFEAAEKHFYKKETEYRKRINALEEIVSEKAGLLKEAEERISVLETENSQMKDWIERLLQYTELSKEDVKKACEKDKAIAGLLDLFGIVKNGGYL